MLKTRIARFEQAGMFASRDIGRSRCSMVSTGDNVKPRQARGGEKMEAVSTCRPNSRRAEYEAYRVL